MTADKVEACTSNGDENGSSSNKAISSPAKTPVKSQVFNPPDEFSRTAHVKSFDEYKTEYKKSIDDPEGFWKNIADTFYFHEPQPSNRKVFDYNFNINNGPISIKFMEGAKTNICYNLLDYNIEKRGLKDTIAFYWEGNEPTDTAKITYGELHEQVCKFSNVLKSLGVERGDRIGIYLPMILEVAIAMLACARIGAIHSVVFGGHFDKRSLPGLVPFWAKTTKVKCPNKK